MGEESMPEPATLAETIAHPVRLRIIQQLGGRSLTTAQLREALRRHPGHSTGTSAPRSTPSC